MIGFVLSWPPERGWCSLSTQYSSLALTLWRRTRGRNVLGIVGDFFEGLACQLLGLELAEGRDGVDAIGRKQNIAFEVKGCDHGNRPGRFPVDQIDSHLGISSGFPFDDLVFVLFGYNNPRTTGRRGGKPRTGLSRCRGQQAIRAFLAQHVSAVWLLDGELIRHLRNGSGNCVRSGVLACQPSREVVEVTREFLADFTNGHRQETMRGLGLNSRAWVIRTASEVQVTFGCDSLIPTTIQVTAVLRLSLWRKWRPRVLCGEGDES